jgi:hypothetical protein
MYDDQHGEGTYLPVSDYLDALAGPEPHPDSVMSQALRMAATVAEIANEYNVRHMTVYQMAEMSRRLYLAGAICLPEYAVMSFQPNLYPEFRSDVKTYRRMQKNPEDPRDFVAAWREHVELVRRTHPDPESLTLAMQIADLLESFVPLDEGS